MAYTILNLHGESIPHAAWVRGSLAPFTLVKVTISGTTTSETITFPQYSQIFAVFPASFSSGNNYNPADIDIVISGNTVTVANGSTFDLDAASQTLYLLVFGD